MNFNLRLDFGSFLARFMPWWLSADSQRGGGWDAYDSED